ncbi:hypothetical protein C8R43DRAFT_1066365 [Mycena crocata]|nr:hypothetical protein C8R43DRAFT_1066365 [Mycena crocata]
MDVNSTLTEPQRVGQLWFEDGNIVIQAGNSQFRVFRGILAAQSPVFKDMFSLPQPADSEAVDGCPVVRLHDSKEDLTVFLRAIFDPEFLQPYPRWTELTTIASCLRLSQKYEVNFLRRRALVHLSARYPIRLADYDEYNPPVPMRDVNHRWDRWMPHIHAIQLARETDVPWILPLAFYKVSSAFSDEGSVMEFFDALSGRNNGSPRLSAQDRQVFLLGHHLQSHMTVTHILRFLLDGEIVTGCITPTHCVSGRNWVYKDCLDTLKTDSNSPLEFFWQWAELEGRVCSICLASLEQTHQEAREKLWADLPAMYSQPLWKELEELREAAIGDELAEVHIH